MSRNNNLSLKQKIDFNLFNVFKHAETKLHKLQYLFWEATLKCNLSCLHCGSDCHSSRTEQDMPAEVFLKTTAEIAEKYDASQIVIVITGGEPLLRKDLEIIGAELIKQGFSWGMVSNGMLLTQKRLSSLLKAGMSSITISLDGVKEEHEWLRNTKNSYEKVLKAIRLLSNVPNLSFDVATCVNSRNLKSLETLKSELLGNGVKKWRLFSITPIGRAADIADLKPKSGELKQLLNFIETCRESGEIQASYGCEGFLGSYEKQVRDDNFFCRAGIHIGGIMSNGDILACPNIDRRYKQGNIYMDSLTDIWENKFDIMRNRHWMKKGKCDNCKQFKYCKGNAMHLHTPDQNDVLFCHYEELNELIIK
jgi:radical SAM enzyme (rSAM/lipoprotein system)